MNDTSENAGNGGAESSRKLESLRETWRKRARNNRIIAWCYSIGVGALFVGACVVVWFAGQITEGTFDLAYRVAVGAPERLEERLEERVTLPRRFDFRGVALGRGDDTVFAVGDDGFILAAGSGSDLRNWESLPSNTGKDFHGIAVSDDGGVVIAVGRNGLVRRSVDRGNTWTDPGGVAAQDVNGVALSSDGGTAILVGDDGLVRTSVDGGETWPDSVVFGRVEGRPKNVNGVALSGDGKTAVLVGDDGLVWRFDDDSNEVSSIIVETEQGRPKDVNGVALSSDGGTAILVGDDGLAGTLTNGGATWTPCATNVGDDLNGVTLSGDGKTAVAAGDDGLVLFFDVDVQKGGCSGVRGGNVGTPHRLHAPVLDEDSDEGVVAIVVGRNRTIVRSDVSSSPSEGGPVGDLRVSKRPDEREEPQDESRDSRLSELSWQLYFYSTSLCVGIIVILMFWVGHLAGFIRYHLRLAAHYDDRRYAIALVEEGLQSGLPAGLPYLERAIDALSSDGIGFSNARVEREKIWSNRLLAPLQATEGTVEDLKGDER